MQTDAEHLRLDESRTARIPWKKWGPYLSERQWGTVREDYSENGDAWNYFSHKQARSRAYRWGEDGIAGISDDQQLLCFALAMWNGKDQILKERMFGLTNGQGNHGEDVKEYYFYLDNTPTHSYMKYLYKYPQEAYPYEELEAGNRLRGKRDFEFELIDTGIFEGDRYFDVLIEYAKAAPEDILIRITAANRGPCAAALHLLPTLWFRNTWSWGTDPAKPRLGSAGSNGHSEIVKAVHDKLGEFELHCRNAHEILFTENETNVERLFGKQNRNPYVKDAFHEYLVNRRKEAVNPRNTGTKVAARYCETIEPGQSQIVRLRLTTPRQSTSKSFSEKEFDGVFAKRIEEANAFYASIAPKNLSEDSAVVLRQASAGMLWGKQYFMFDADKWLTEHRANPILGGTRHARNRDWYHMLNHHVISMPDKWEYPWYAAWDLAFHCVAFATIDPDFAREQLYLMLSEVYLHPSGQVPAYEWNYSDVNPPVHAWATMFLHRFAGTGDRAADLEFLKRCLLKLELNFSWWVNRKDLSGRNVFEGGFLGMDNIGVFDRSVPLPTGGHLEQADGTAWMALFCQNMIEMSAEIASADPAFQDLCVKYVEHFFWIASGMNHTGSDGMWDEEDGFYYDVLRYPDGSSRRLKVRSMVGLLPLCATTTIEEWQREQVRDITPAIMNRLARTPELLQSVHATGPESRGFAGRGILALVNEQRLRRVLTKVLDEAEFLGPFGLRSLSRYHLDHPYEIHVGGARYRIGYLPAESDSTMFGGNSNWRGPVWMPINVLVIRALLQYYLYYGDAFQVECPTGSGRLMNLFEVARELCLRLERIFLKDETGRRPVFGGAEKFQTDPHWRDHLLFYEYFHGDNGAGLGASHQTGWTGLIGFLIQLVHSVDGRTLLESGARGIQVGLARSRISETLAA